MGATEARWVEVLLNRYTDVSLLRHYRRELGVLLLAALLVAGGLGHLLARRGLQPLGTLAGTIALVDARSLEAPIQQPDAPAEVRALAASFETMRSRLSTAFSHLSTELAHDLRTPLHILRQQAEVALRRARSPQEYQEVLGSQLEELERLRRMVDDTLFLARAEDPRARIHCESLLAGEELAAVAEFLDALAIEYDVEVVVETPRELLICADRLLLRRALVNLITNALYHVPPGGRVTVTAHTDGDAVAIVVQDSGAGVAPELLPHVFDRYVRTNRVRAAASGNDSSSGQEPGTGLGLAIVHGIMALHGGTATMESEVGQGATVTLRFPELPAPNSRPVKTVILP